MKQESLTQEQINEAVTGLSISSFESLYIRKKAIENNNDPSYVIRESVIQAIGLYDMPAFLFNNHDLSNLIEPNERYNPEENDMLELLESTISGLKILKKFLTKDLIEQLPAEYVIQHSYLSDDLCDDPSIEKSLKAFINNKATRESAYILTANCIDVALKFYLYMKAFYLQGRLTLTEICNIIEELGHTSKDREERIHRLVSYDDSFNSLIKPIKARYIAKEKKIKNGRSAFTNIQFDFGNKAEFQNIETNLSRMLKDIYSVINLTDKLITCK